MLFPAKELNDRGSAVLENALTLLGLASEPEDGLQLTSCVQSNLERQVIAEGVSVDVLELRETLRLHLCVLTGRWRRDSRVFPFEPFDLSLFDWSFSY